MLANVGQDNAAILRHDRRPGVVLAPHDRAFEDFEAVRVVARFAAEKAQGFFSAAAAQLSQRHVSQCHARRASVEAQPTRLIREKSGRPR